MEHFFQCPYCWEQISMILDRSAGEQLFVEDCEVCCNPIEVKLNFQNGELVVFQASDLGQ